MVGSVVSFPVLYHRTADCLALALVFHNDIQLRCSGCLLFWRSLSNHSAHCSVFSISAARL